MVDDQPSAKRPTESQSGPARGDIDEDAVVAPLLEIQEFMIAPLAAEAAQGGENHRLREENYGLDSPEYVDILHDDTSGGSIGPCWKPGDKQNVSSSSVLECGMSYLD